MKWFKKCQHCWHKTWEWPSGSIEQTCCWCAKKRTGFPQKYVTEPGHGKFGGKHVKLPEGEYTFHD